MPADPLDALQLVADAVATHPNEQVRLVGDWLRAGGRGDVLEYLSGNDNARGFSARLAVKLGHRNRALRAAAARWSNLAPSEQAHRVTDEVARYRGAGWQRDRHCAANPHLPGTSLSLFWSALMALDRPISKRQCRRILFGQVI
jgi:hypothetical protein